MLTAIRENKDKNRIELLGFNANGVENVDDNKIGNIATKRKVYIEPSYKNGNSEIRANYYVFRGWGDRGSSYAVALNTDATKIIAGKKSWTGDTPSWVYSITSEEELENITKLEELYEMETNSSLNKGSVWSTSSDDYYLVVDRYEYINNTDILFEKDSCLYSEDKELKVLFYTVADEEGRVRDVFRRTYKLTKDTLSPSEVNTINTFM